MTSTLKVGEEENNKNLQESNGIKNKMNASKYNTVEKFNIRLAVFILNLIHELYWDEFTINENEENIKNFDNEKSHMQLKKCFDTIIPVAKNLTEVFNKLIDNKFPTNLSISALSLEINSEVMQSEIVINQGLKKAKINGKKKRNNE